MSANLYHCSAPFVENQIRPYMESFLNAARIVHPHDRSVFKANVKSFQFGTFEPYHEGSMLEKFCEHNGLQLSWWGELPGRWNTLEGVSHPLKSCYSRSEFYYQSVYHTMFFWSGAILGHENNRISELIGSMVLNVKISRLNICHMLSLLANHFHCCPGDRHSFNFDPSLSEVTQRVNHVFESLGLSRETGIRYQKLYKSQDFGTLKSYNFKEKPLYVTGQSGFPEVFVKHQCLRPHGINGGDS